MHHVVDPRLARLDRLRHSDAWSVAGSLGGFGATAIAGFEPVGQVFGTTVAFLGPAGLGHCFVPSPKSRTSAAVHNPLLAKLKAARLLALERAVAECQALGGDGIVGMRVKVAKFFTETVEFAVEGTAVRARSSTRPDTPFTTHVSGQDLARLLRSGWMPFALLFGMSIAACHYDDSMFQQTRRGVGAAANREVTGYTRLVNDARHQARTTLEDAVRERGGEGAVLHEATLTISERECPLFDQRVDYIAEATILGSALVSLEPGSAGARQGSLSIMRLDHRLGAEPEPEPDLQLAPRLGLGDRAFAYWSRRQAES
jgi:uncharacterized protein YbjQ (UPF0145 family)